MSMAIISFRGVTTLSDELGNQNDNADFLDTLAGSSKPDDSCNQEIGPQRTFHLGALKPAKLNFTELQTIVRLQTAEILQKVRENLAQNLPCQISHMEDGVANNYYIVGIENDGTMTMHRYIDKKTNSITKITADDIINHFTDEDALFLIGAPQTNASGIVTKCTIQ